VIGGNLDQAGHHHEDADRAEFQGDAAQGVHGAVMRLLGGACKGVARGGAERRPPKSGARRGTLRTAKRAAIRDRPTGAGRSTGVRSRGPDPKVHQRSGAALVGGAVHLPRSSRGGLGAGGLTTLPWPFGGCLGKGPLNRPWDVITRQDIARRG
jgi:hypothetical protein